MGYNFTQQQCIRALLKIGFTDASKRRAKHFKYKPPSSCTKNFDENVRPFITVPKHDFYCQDAIVREVATLCGEEMKQKFLESI
jgi:hypothetical protein